jgi:hypothetical protein
VPTFASSSLRSRNHAHPEANRLRKLDVHADATLARVMALVRWRQESHHCRALQHRCAHFREGYLTSKRMFDDPRFGERLISGDCCEGRTQKLAVRLKAHSDDSR